MKPAILIPNIASKEIIDSCQKFCDTIVLYTKEDVLNEKVIPKNKIAFYLLLKENEEIKFCDDLRMDSKVFVTDHEWMIKQKRIFHNNEAEKYLDDGNPIIIKTKNKIYGPFINDEKLKKLYVEKRYEEFVMEAEKFIFDNYSKNFPFIRYYMAMIYFFKLNNPEKTQQHLSLILNSYKYMSEAWCLLGDILIESKKHFDAIKAYENAIIYGKERNLYDGDPVLLKKYNKYPKEMLDKLNNLISNTKVVSINSI